MLRLLARTVGHVWNVEPDDAYAIHLHHIDLAHEPIRQELVTRLGLTQYAPALKSDVFPDARELAEAGAEDRHSVPNLIQLLA